MRPSAERLVALVGLLILPASGALAGRALDEPARLVRAARRAPRVDVDAALAAAGATDRCKDALRVSGLRGVECRALVDVALARKRTLDAAGDADAKAAVDARADAFADVARVAQSVSSWKPLSPVPGLGRARFETHRALSRGLMALYDDVRNARSAGVRARAPAMKSAACTAAARTVELARGADAGADERGAVQELLTSHACFLDESKLEARPTPTALKDNTDPAALAATDAGAVKDYAASRAIDLKRCVDKYVSAALRVDDEGKALSCLCRAMARWHTPKPRDALEVPIPLTSALAVRVHVTRAGTIDHCVSIVGGR